MFVGRGLKRPDANERVKSVRRRKPTSGLKAFPTFRNSALDAVAIRHPVELALIALVVAGEIGGLGARVVAAEGDVLIEAKRRIDAVGLVVARRVRRQMVAIGEHRADGAAAQDVALDARDGEVRRRRRRRRLVAGLDVEHADAPPADLAGQAAADVDRHDAAAVEADAPAVEHVGHVGGAAEAGARYAATAAARRAAAAEVEQASALEKELALLGQEQVEARQVDLLLVDLDLREVGVHGEIGGQVRGDAVLQIAADIAVVVVAASADWRCDRSSSCRARTA